MRGPASDGSRPVPLLDDTDHDDISNKCDFDLNNIHIRNQLILCNIIPKLSYENVLH